MVQTVHLLPPLSGPQSDPVIFGVADALARLFPVEPPARSAFDGPSRVAAHASDKASDREKTKDALAA